MKKILVYIFAAVFISSIIIIYEFNEEIINYLISIDFSNSKIIYTYILVSSLYFISPLPVTIIILLNGFFFKELGFYISIFQIFLGSTLLNLFSKKIKNFFNINLSNKIKSKIFNLRKISENNYSIFFTRYLLPYFIHNLYYGLTKVKLFRFLIIVIISEIPMTYAINSIGSSLNKISFDYTLSVYTLFTDINFYIPFLIIFMVFIITNYLNSKK
tara:strand:- start:47 stop:691 length:645 start_codon:yes stop_codon:yes gene_type:complete